MYKTIMSNTIQMYSPTRDYKNHQPEYDAAISKVLESGLFINGPEVIELEDNLANYIGDGNKCVAVSSGTDALYIALLTLGIGPGDEVITTPFTWISSAEVICLAGAKPVFVDIKKDTFNLNPYLIADKITDKTKAIIVVDLFGQLADYPQIKSIMKDIPIIQDFAQSFGAEQNGIKAGNQGIISCTSFFPSKPLGGYGDGGACFTKDNDLYTKMKAIRNHGGVIRNFHDHVGMNGRLDTLQAAILLVKMKYFEQCRIDRNKVAKMYTQKLELYNRSWMKASPIKLPYTRSMNNVHVWAAYTLRVERRDELIKYLKEHDVNITVFYPRPLHQQPVFIRYGYRDGDFPIAEKVSKEVISLPCYPELEEWEQRTIISLIKKFYQLV